LGLCYFSVKIWRS